MEGFTPWSENDDMMVCGMTIASFDPAMHVDDLLSIYVEFTLPPETKMGKGKSFLIIYAMSTFQSED